MDAKRDLQLQPKEYFEGWDNDEDIKYAVIYDTDADSVSYDDTYMDYIRVVRKMERYECIDFFSTKERAIKRAEELPTITNRNYTLKAVLERQGKKIVQIM